MVEQVSRLPLFPVTASVNARGHLVIGGCDVVELANEFGTPLYIFDEAGMRAQCAGYKAEFGKLYKDLTVIYASKAFINKAWAKILNEEGIGLDVASGGEIGIARSVDFPMDKLYFHGNNKSAGELNLALEVGIGRIVVDNFHELQMLGNLAARKRIKPKILLRITPGVDPHTHQYISTGNIDSKFGFPLAKAEEAVQSAMTIKSLDLVGLHFHIGSLIFDVDVYQQAAEYIINFASAMNQKHGFEMKELDVGGGFASQYTVDQPSPPISYFAVAITSTIISKCKKLGMALPKLIIEPGRSIVARAGVAVYEVGAIKEIPNVRTYVCVDGGMGDNIRPALYGSKLEAVIASRMKDNGSEKFTIAGKFCESGDILIKDLELPQPTPGDILAVAACGAYSVPMASNYNAFFLPPVVLVKDGKARLIRRRQTLEDLTKCDLDLE